MTGSERKTCVCSTSDRRERQRRIRDLNDGLRRFARCGIITITPGVQAMGTDSIAAVLLAVREFAAFTTDNDPYDEHDMGGMRVSGERILWKIDYYDKNRQYGSPDPADPSVTCRVLTVMLAGEY